MAFPREIWRALQPAVVGKHPWNGGNVGHPIVFNGFTHDRRAGAGGFHVIDSWAAAEESGHEEGGRALRTRSLMGYAVPLTLGVSPRCDRA